MAYYDGYGIWAQPVPTPPPPPQPCTKPRGFWLVWCPTGTRPTFRHPSSTSANTEANRLSKLNPGKEFYVLKTEAMKKVPVVTPPVETLVYA